MADSISLDGSTIGGGHAELLKELRLQLSPFVGVAAFLFVERGRQTQLIAVKGEDVMKKIIVLALMVFSLSPALVAAAQSGQAKTEIKVFSQVPQTVQAAAAYVAQDATNAQLVACSGSLVGQEEGRRGCCSWHGGVSYCGPNGYWICNDGTQSPSCTCP